MCCVVKFTIENVLKFIIYTYVYSHRSQLSGSAENARPENDGQKTEGLEKRQTGKGPYYVAEDNVYNAGGTVLYYL